MPDFRRSGVTSSRSYPSYSSGSYGRSYASSPRPTRQQERERAFSRPGTGQWIPGALSGLASGDGSRPSGTYESNRQFTQPINQPRLVTVNGQSGYLVPVQNEPPPTILGESEAFALKRKMAEGVPQPAMSGSPGGDFAIPGMQNTTNPFMPNFSGEGFATNPFDQMMEGGASMMPNTPEAQAGAERGGILGAMDAYFNWGDSVEEAMGMVTRDEQGNITSWETPAIAGLGVTLGGTASTIPKSLSRLFSTATAGKITRDTFYRGSAAKSAQTFSKWLRQSLKSKNLLKTFNPRTMSLKTAGLLATGVVTAAWLGYSLVKGGRGEQVMGTWGMREELPQMCSMMSEKLKREDNPEGAKQIIDICREKGNEAIEFSLIPGKTGIKANNNYFDGWNQIMDVVDEHDTARRELMAENPELVEGTSEYWLAHQEKSIQKENEAARLRNEAFNRSKEYGERMAIQLRAQAQIETIERNRKFMEDQAKFWEEYRKKIIAMEDNQMKRQGKFWMNYRRTLMQMEEDSRGLGRSRLKFGLL